MEKELIMGKKVLITGASRGIGAECARAFARAGYDVAIHYNTSADMAEALCAELSAMGSDAFTVQADVSGSAFVREMFGRVYERFGSLDVLVNNAGASLINLLTDTSDEEWDHITDTDLGGVFMCCREALPAMIRAHKGCIINIASMWGETGASCEAVYSAAKAGVIGLTKALAKEVGPSGIRVNAVSPGVIMTDMMAGFGEEDLRALREEIPLGRLGEPSDVAAAVVFLASDEAGYITGQVLSVNGGMVI